MLGRTITRIRIPSVISIRLMSNVATLTKENNSLVEKFIRISEKYDRITDEYSKKSPDLEK